VFKCRLSCSLQGNTLIVRAIRNVRQGDEVFNCYGPHYRRMRRTERLEALEAQYCFTCTCDSCLDKNTEDFQVAESRLLFLISGSSYYLFVYISRTLYIHSRARLAKDL
jgi:hypothetical protein